MNALDKLKTNSKLLVGIVVLIILVMVASTLIKAFSSDAAEGNKNYNKIYAVPGVTFEVNQSLANYATAVMEISKDVDFIHNASYSYKNGTDTYMLFNMSQYVVVAKKGTTFDFNNTKIADSLKTNSLEGIWFSNGKMLSSSADKSICEVSAQVVITNTIYNDFFGKLATVTNNGEEWSLFVGSVNPEDSNMNAMIDYTINTFIADASNEGEDLAVYEMDVEEQPMLKVVTEMEEEEPSAIEDVEPIVTTPSESEESSEAAIPEETPVTEPIETEEPTEPETEAPEEDIPVELPEETTEPTEEAPSTESAQEETTESVESEDVEQIPEDEPIEQEEVIKDTMLTAENNQKKPIYNDDKAYSSSIYSMLSVGKIGYMTATNQETGSYEEIFVQITSVNDEETTNALIEKYIASGKSYYETMVAPAGTHWESITYNVNHAPEKNFYIDIQFVGMDGESLKHRGIEYSMRTYDIDTMTTAGEDNWTNNYIAFYAVPNGCNEYAISCGDSADGHGYKAYYKVK